MIRVMLDRKIGKPYKVVEGYYQPSNNRYPEEKRSTRWVTKRQHSEHNTREEANRAKEEIENE